MFSFIVLSSDGYNDCWDPFFTLLLKYFPDVANQEIILSTNFKDYSKKGLEIKIIKHGNAPWSKRFRDSLIKAENDIVFVVLEDFVLRSKMDFNRFNYYLNLISQEANSIDHIRMLSLIKTDVVASKYEGLDEINFKSNYRYVLMPGLWRRSSLIKYITEHESPYMNEVMGNLKSRIIKHNFFTVSHIQSNQSGDLYNSATAGTIYKGKWAKWVPDFFEKENIIVDFNIRGFRTNDYRKKARIKTWMSVLNEPRSLYISLKSLINLYFINMFKY